MKIKDIMRSYTEEVVGKKIHEDIEISELRKEEFSSAEDKIYVVNSEGKTIGFAERNLLEYLIETNGLLCGSNIIDYFGEAIIAIDKQGRVFYVNRAYSTILGVPAKKIIGKYIYKVEENAELYEVLKTKMPKFKKKHFVKSVKRYVAVKMYPLHINGEVEGAFSIFTDITEIDNLGKEINRITNVAEEYSSQIEAQKELEKLHIIGESPRFINLISQSLVVSKTDVPVLIRGENGVGKEVFTKIIHNNSNRKNKQFITVNCAAIPEALIESELFGYEEGAFTGAKHGGKMGKFQLADGGTLFLDEIGDMPLMMQSKLLRVLQQGEIEKIGRQKNIPVNVRIIAATNQPLEKMIKEKKFREDLYYRLNVFSIDIPPLRNRGNDAILLANHFLEIYNHKYNKNVVISDEVYSILSQYKWPGNVRELENCIEHGVILCGSGKLEISNLPESIKEKFEELNIDKTIKKENINITNLKDALDEYEKQLILLAIKESGESKSKAMKLLGLSRRTFYRKIKEHNI